MRIAGQRDRRIARIEPGDDGIEHLALMSENPEISRISFGLA
jgi:hypothetical protein